MQTQEKYCITPFLAHRRQYILIYIPPHPHEKKNKQKTFITITLKSNKTSVHLHNISSVTELSFHLHVSQRPETTISLLFSTFCASLSEYLAFSTDLALLPNPFLHYICTYSLLFFSISNQLLHLT